MKKEEWKDKAAEKIANTALRIQVKACLLMSRLSSKVSVFRLKSIVVIVCCCSTGFSLYLIANALLSKPVTPILPERIQLPTHNNVIHDELGENNVDSSTYKQIQEYKKFMDSTKQTIRASLMDSIKVLEEIYLSQQTK
ncbi:MAG: hypothetical protein ABI675_14520 [Chitinophagaceae bacterium]